MSYWVITKDHINTLPNNEGFGFIKGLFPGEEDQHQKVNLNSTEAQDWINTLPCRFKLYDEGGDLHYEGRAVEADFDAQDWAEANDGVPYTMHKLAEGAENETYSDRAVR
jgi:hypothetical protein